MKTSELINLEWRLLKRDRVFCATTLIGILILLYGFSNGQSWMRWQTDRIIEHEQEGKKRYGELLGFVEQVRKDHLPLPLNLAEREHDPRYALGFAFNHLQNDCRRPAPLAALAVGQSDLYTYCLSSTAWGVEGREDEGNSMGLENPLRLLLGRFDAAFALILLMPICILVISYDLLSRERELGTLPLLMSQPLALRCLLSMRFGIRTFLFVSLSLLTIIISLACVGADFTDRRTVMELILWLIITAAYLLFWFACAFWVNSRGGTSAEHGLQLAGLWLVLVVIMPGCLNLALKQMYPSPSRMDYIDKVRGTSVSIEKKKSALLGKYLGDHPDLVAGNKKVNTDDFIQSRILIADETERTLAPIKATFRQHYAKQQAFVEDLRFISPAITYQHIAQLLTGQDRTRHQRFLDATEAHHQALRSFYFPRLNQDGPNFKAYDAIPKFNFQEQPLTVLVKATLTALLGIVIPTVILLGWGALKLRKLPIECR
ncbi:MAG: DUF3526 domain-containing protein [Methyloglobulus sp.]|nr:DUF3526 domain-containing protein [Methyloglobulus sp.]